VPYFMVQNYAIVKQGAWPGSCWPSYAIDYPVVEAYLEDGPEALARHLDAAPETKTRVKTHAEARQHG
jgi:glutaconate CoA-transferase, subunit A